MKLKFCSHFPSFTYHIDFLLVFLYFYAYTNAEKHFDVLINIFHVNIKYQISCNSSLLWSHE